MLRLSRLSCLTLQFAFLSSFYLVLLHVQGSLAMIMGMAPGLITIALLSRLFSSPSWRVILLTAIVMAGYFSIYSEPALFNILIPSGLLLVWQLFQRPSRFLRALVNLSIVYFLVLIFAPYAVESVISTAVGNVLLVGSNFIHSHHETITTTHSIAQSIRHTLIGPSLDPWNLAAVVYGAMSYYDTSSLNAHISSYFGQKPFVALLGFIVLCGAGIIGFLKKRNTLTILMVTPLILWFVASFIMGQSQDFMRFARGLHYSIPFAIIGLVILASRNRSFHINTVTWIGRALLACFIIMNVCTTNRTLHYLASHHIDNDTILLHFNDRDPHWKQLADELRISAKHNAPVLISGFQDTIKPLAISIMMRNQPHVLGYSILSFWRLYDPINPLLNLEDFLQLYDINQYQTTLDFNIKNLSWQLLEDILSVYRSENYPTHTLTLQEINQQVQDIHVDSTIKNQNLVLNLFNYYHNRWPPINTGSPEVNEWWLRCNTRLTEKEMIKIEEREGKPWPDVESRLINDSEQAVVPVGHNSPTEWLYTQDVYAPLMKRFHSVCDVIYRNNYSVILDKKMVSGLKQDEIGPFRSLTQSGNIIVHKLYLVPQQLTLVYDGNVNDIRLKVGTILHNGKLTEQKGRIKITAQIHPEDASKLNLIVTHNVKLRSITWTPVTL